MIPRAAIVPNSAKAAEKNRQVRRVSISEILLSRLAMSALVAKCSISVSSDATRSAISMFEPACGGIGGLNDVTAWPPMSWTGIVAPKALESKVRVVEED